MAATHRSRRVILTSGVVLALLMTAFGFIIVQADRSAFDAMDERMEGRVAVAAGFVSSYVQDVLADERAQAEAWLASSHRREVNFDRVTQASGFQAAVLLADDGELQGVWPPKRSLVGSDFAGKYAHLDAALQGRTAISNVVPSAAKGTPIVAFATPFRTDSGSAVYSGAMSIHDSPLGKRYLKSVATIPGRRVYLIDSGSQIVASSHTLEGASLADADRDLQAVLGGEGSGHYEDQGVDRFFAAAAVAGTPWRIVMTVPAANLYAPVAGANRAIPWIVFGSFGVLALVVLLLLWQAREKAVVLTDTNSQLQVKNDEVEVLAEQLGHLSLLDALTGTHNRRGFEARFEQQAQDAKRAHEQLEVLFIDINDMKSINDVHGHSAGDEALIVVAQALVASCRESDVVGRLGGDEFAVSGACIGSPGVLADRIASGLALLAERLPYRLTVSIGSSTFSPGAEQSLSEVLERADVQMYLQKKRVTQRGLVEVAL